MLNAKIEKHELVIRIPLQTPAPSASGKTLVVASSHGNQPTTATVKHEGKDAVIIVGLNAYIRR
jgi:hypothetical protein